MALCEFRYFSPALGKQTTATIILPENIRGRFPVLYLLHGLSDDHTVWLRQTSIERYVAQLPLIVVMPDGGRGFYVDAPPGAGGYAYGTALAIELPDRIDRTFPTIASRDGRCVAGLSMGGYGAVRFALGYPERFCAAVSHSGCVRVAHRPPDWNDAHAPELQHVFGNPSAGGPNDLFALSSRIDRAILPALRLDCGTSDFLLQENREFHAHLTAIGVPHEHAEHPGDHNWEYWDRHIRDTLAFLSKHLGINPS